MTFGQLVSHSPRRHPHRRVTPTKIVQQLGKLARGSAAVLQVFATCLALAGASLSVNFVYCASLSVVCVGRVYIFCAYRRGHPNSHPNSEVPVMIMANFGMHWRFGIYATGPRYSQWESADKLNVRLS